MTAFPTIASSFRFDPHEPLFTYYATTPPDVQPAMATDTMLPSMTTRGTTSVRMMTLILVSGSGLAQSGITTATPTAQSLEITSVPASSNTASNSQSVDPATAIGGLDKGAKIGIIVSITVVVVLSVIAISFCLFDGRRRIQRWREKAQARKDAETHMWETELRNGQTGAKKDYKTGGLWNNLRIDKEVDIESRENMNASGNTVSGISAGGTYERRSRDISRRDRVGEGRSESADTRVDQNLVKNVRVNAHAPERVSERLIVHVPRDRTSIVSSAGSLGTPVVGLPVIAKNMLDK